ncbi:hypothetical protein GM921_03955 [Pedobacter sp. LMG 31464]|uniref:Uncharacterized protein n=1 Tax=Pedobacter planticolens TaxID=2679964 RepID=A0A923DZ33_9SPHI|nr:hypothetical protein [Pedobacter planticolens]MBB2144624.1 hypothetical protein [Pedobacter planticolens]
MILSKRAKLILDVIEKNQDESMLKQLQNAGPPSTLGHFKSYLEITLVLIEKSKFSNSAIKVFIDLLTKENSYLESIEFRAKRMAIAQILSDGAVEPYARTAHMLGMFILEQYRHSNTFESRHIASIFSATEILAFNESYLSRYLAEHTLDDSSMMLLYSCISGLDNSKIYLSDKSLKLVKAKLEDDRSRFFYLHNFIRPLYLTESKDFPDATLHVAEPFYKQIFGSQDNFINFLQVKSVNLDEQMLKDDLFRIITYMKMTGSEYFDAQGFRLHRKHHAHLRIID